MEGPTTKRNFREKRQSGEVYDLGGLGVLPQNIFVFLSSLDLISCNFSMIFGQKGTFSRGPKPFSGGANTGGGWGGFVPSSIYVKRGPVLKCSLSCFQA